MIVLFVFIVSMEPLRKVPVKPETHRFTPYQAWHFPERPSHPSTLRLTSRNVRPDCDTRSSHPRAMQLIQRSRRAFRPETRYD